MSTPSSDHFVLAGLAPRDTKFDCWPDMLPPMFSRSMAIPAVCWRMTQGSRAEGMLWSISVVNVCLVPVLFVSTIGLSPVTVTVSCTVETPIWVVRLALKPTVTWMSCLTIVLKPGSSNLTV